MKPPPLISLALLVAVVSFALSGSASAVTITPGPNTVSAARIAMDFGGDSGLGDPERVDSLVWTDSNGVQSVNLAKQGGGTCGDALEFFGQSFGGGGFVVGGSTGTWTNPTARTVQVDSVASAPCGSNIPIRTTYAFYDTAPTYNQVAVTRRFDFTQSHPSADIRAYVPRLELTKYGQTLYPSNASTPTLQMANSNACGSGCTLTDWAGTWFALNDPATGRGLLILRDSHNQEPAKLLVDSDGSSYSNLSSVDFPDPGAGGWTGLVSETEYLCLYDLESWPQARRDSLQPPEGCGPVPVNLSPPTVSGDVVSGHTLTADPGTWSANPTFAYQWRRCNTSGGNCQDIPGEMGQTYTVTDQDQGSALVVHVVATGGGGSATADSEPTGAAFGPQRASLSPGAIAFTSRAPETTSAPEIVSVTNTGTGPLHVSGVGLSGSQPGAFKITSDGCTGQTVAPQAACSLLVAFAPTARASFAALLAVTDDAPGSPHTVPLSGAGITPSATLDASAIDFGNVFAGGPSASRKLTITNPGEDALNVGGVSISGTEASAFSKESHCSRVEHGGSCTIDVTFTPVAPGHYEASLRLDDDAKDSPQIVKLVGVGAPTVAGRVLDQSGQPAGDIYVQGCVGSKCDHARSGQDGVYGLTLPPGLGWIEAYPGNPRLLAASASVRISPDLTVTQDLRLTEPVPLSHGVTFLTPDGEKSSGVPVVNWEQPFAFKVPVYVRRTAAPNSTIVYGSESGIDNAAGDGNGGFGLIGALLFSIHYGPSGVADGMSRIVTGQLDCGTAGESTCGDLLADETPVAGGQVGSRRTPAHRLHAAAAGERTYFVLSLPSGSHVVRDIVISPSDRTGSLTSAPVQITPSPPHAQTEADSDSAAHVLDALDTLGPYDPPAAHGDDLIAIPATFSIASLKRQVHGAFQYFTTEIAEYPISPQPAGKVAEKYTEELLPPTPECPGGIRVFHHPLPVNTKEGVYVYISSIVAPDREARICLSRLPGSPRRPNASCTPRAEWIKHEPGDHPFPPCRDGGNLYVDPSGQVETPHHVPLEGAHVTLTRASKRAGPQTRVPNGSVIMSPANRRNPDRTGLLGMFHWDVTPGFYRVTATRNGCRAKHGKRVRTRVLPVPPPALDLKLTLNCPHLRLLRTTTRLRARHALRGGLALRATIRAPRRARGRLLGTVVFKVGHRTVGTVAVDPKTGVARLSSPLRIKRGAATAVFSGNAAVAGSSGRAKLR